MLQPTYVTKGGILLNSFQCTCTKKHKRNTVQCFSSEEYLIKNNFVEKEAFSTLGDEV